MVHIITDTASDLDAAEYARHSIGIIPLIVSFGSQEYMETTQLVKSDFYRLLSSSPDFPKTAQSSPAVLADLLTKIKNDGDEAVCITLASSISGFYQGAVMAKEMSGLEECCIVDSKSATAGQRILVELAVQLRDAGKNAREIAQALEEIRSKITIYACLDNLDSLYKGGRISAETKFVGSLLGIKPIICLKDGVLSVCAKVRGMKKGMDYICRQMAQADTTRPIFPMYTDSPEIGLELVAQMQADGTPALPENMKQVGCAIGSHIGHNACGVAFVGK